MRAASWTIKGTTQTGEKAMKPWEQRLTGWGALAIALVSVAAALISLWILWHLEKDHFQNPLAAPVGITWDKERALGGTDTVPVEYSDILTLTNTTGNTLENVELAVSNWANSTEVKTSIGRLDAEEKRRLDLLDKRLGFPARYEISPRDVLIVRVSGYAEKRIPVKELGKDKTLLEIANDEDKENNADKEFFPKLWKWQDDLRKKGIQPTEDMYKAWLKEKEEARRKEKGR
jgi:hypothetical protein